MLIVTGILEINPDNIAAAQDATRAVMEETRKEDGCLVYEFSQQVEAPHRFRVYEEWTDGAALKAHGGQPHMSAFRKALREIGVTGSEFHTISGGEKKKLG